MTLLSSRSAYAHALEREYTLFVNLVGESWEKGEEGRRFFDQGVLCVIIRKYEQKEMYLIYRNSFSWC